MALLKENTTLHRSSRWNDCKRKFETAEAYKQCESSTQREDWFREHVRTLPERTEEEKEKEKEAEKLARKRKHRSSSRDADSSGKKRSRKDKKEKKEGEEDGDDKKTKEEGEVGDESQTEDGDKPSTPVDDGLTDEQREKAAKEREAVAARTAQVQAELAGADKVRSAQAEKQRQAEAEDTYRSILTDHVKASQVSIPYKECRRLLRKDDRYAAVSETLDKTVKERLFDDHMRVLLKKRHDQMKTILAEMSTITLTTRWHDAKKTMRDDERLKKMYGSDERTLEREFRDYIDDRVSQAKNDFRQLLRETKIVTHKSKSLISENEQHLKDILSVLENDSRYLLLDGLPDERERLLEQYLAELQLRGTPPPPTATEPDRPNRRLPPSTDGQ